MSPLRPNAVVVLEGAGALPLLEEAVPSGLHRAQGALAAARLLSELRPAALVVRAEVAWHLAFVRGLPPAQRPAVLMTGEPSAVDAAVADEWASEETSVDEWRARLRFAIARSRTRRLAARRAFVDSLTGLPNRRALVLALVRDAERARRSGAPLTLVLMDLDDFKRVNELEGHPAGDRLLRRVGSVLRHAVRAGESCGRLGGDEFAFLVQGPEADARRLIHRVRQALYTIDVGASAAARTLMPGERLRDLYRRTDDALKDEKSRHRAHSREHAHSSFPF